MFSFHFFITDRCCLVVSLVILSDENSDMQKAFWNASVFSVICLFCGYFLLYNVSLKKVFLESETNNSSDKNKGAITEFANAIDIFSGKGEGSHKVTDDIDIMIKEIREKFVVTKPLVSSYNIPCSNRTRPVDNIEDLLCMVRP